ncbi:MAG: hypothetical protein NPIRA03_09880 [Nitrospirales bacterium]|nr:MAG: hypothetical protein NPIRA03_09880 [Nitrospirales bacterium]
MLNVGLQLDYYRMKENLTPDLKYLEALCKPGLRVLYVTYSIGVSQPLLMLRRFVTDYEF